MNHKRFKRIICLILSLVLVLALCSHAFGTVDEKKKELDEVTDDKKKVESQIKINNSQITSLSAEKIEIEYALEVLYEQIDDLTDEINETKAKIVRKLEELEMKQEDIDIQDEALNARLRAMYKNGNSGIISVILNSTSITDLLTNIEMAKRIHVSDENLLLKLHNQYDEIYQAKLELTELKEELLDQQDELTSLKEQKEAKSVELEEKISQISASNEELEAQEAALEVRAAQLTEEIKQLQLNGEFVGGAMSWPTAVTSYITSYYGYRYIFGSTSFHSGIDIGAWWKTKILASNAGKVIKVAYDPDGYGNYVMLDHGGGVVTLYAHAIQILVSTGDYVKRGQAIALVGSTGLSTGCHIHFEMRINGVRVNPIGDDNPYRVYPGKVYYD